MGEARGPRLFFIRHGETDWNAEGRLQGQQDIPINDRGREQAALAGKRLASLRSDAGSLPWIVSPLGRTRETAEIARAAAGLPRDGYDLDPQIKELSFGILEGKTWKEVRREQPELARQREADKWRFVAPGGESYERLTDRIGAWVATAPAEAVVVSHGGVARALMRLLCDLPPERVSGADIWQGRILLFENGRYSWT
ncbi:histidine phosphatase family protein [Alsobacter sp. R-9]